MDFYIILWIFLISVTINLFFCLVIFIFKVTMLTDIIYCLTFICLSTTIIIWKQNFSPVQIALFVIYNVWVLRLTIFLLISVIKNKVDYRFLKFTKSFWKFSMLSIYQGILVFIIAMPTLFALSIDTSYFNNIFSNYLLIFIIIAILFLIVETIADWQKLRFSLRKKHDLLFINYGLWKDCRHPNYLATIGFWYMMVGLFLCDFFLKNISNNINYLFHLCWLLSPLSFNMITVYIIDIPILEVKQWQQLYNNETYQQYIKQTSCIMCYIGKKGPINKVKNIIAIKK